jgi:hypothetical protein
MDVSDWQDITIVGHIKHEPSPHYSSQVEVTAVLSRETTPEWSVSCEEALKGDPARRDSSGMHVGSPVPKIWASVPPERAETIDSLIEEAVGLANRRCRELWLRRPPSAGDPSGHG